GRLPKNQRNAGQDWSASAFLRKLRRGKMTAVSASRYDLSFRTDSVSASASVLKVVQFAIQLHNLLVSQGILKDLCIGGPAAFLEGVNLFKNEIVHVVAKAWARIRHEKRSIGPEAILIRRGRGKQRMAGSVRRECKSNVTLV